jgi:hypothetical protein
MPLLKVYLDEVVDKVYQPFFHIVEEAIDAIIGLFHIDAHGQEDFAQLALEAHVKYVDFARDEFFPVAQFALCRRLHAYI